MKAPLLTLAQTESQEPAYAVWAHLHLLTLRARPSSPTSTSLFSAASATTPAVKRLKIEALVAVADVGNTFEIVTELSEYVSDVEPGIAREAVRGIARRARGRLRRRGAHRAPALAVRAPRRGVRGGGDARRGGAAHAETPAVRERVRRRHLEHGNRRRRRAGGAGRARVPARRIRRIHAGGAVRARARTRVVRGGARRARAARAPRRRGVSSSSGRPRCARCWRSRCRLAAWTRTRTCTTSRRVRPAARPRPGRRGAGRGGGEAHRPCTTSRTPPRTRSTRRRSSTSSTRSLCCTASPRSCSATRTARRARRAPGAQLFGPSRRRGRRHAGAAGDMPGDSLIDFGSDDALSGGAAGTLAFLGEDASPAGRARRRLPGWKRRFSFTEIDGSPAAWGGSRRKLLVGALLDALAPAPRPRWRARRRWTRDVREKWGVLGVTPGVRARGHGFDVSRSRARASRCPAARSRWSPPRRASPASPSRAAAHPRHQTLRARRRHRKRTRLSAGGGRGHGGANGERRREVRRRRRFGGRTEEADVPPNPRCAGFGRAFLI